MIINGSNGTAAEVTPDGRVRTLAGNESFMHIMAEIGRAWTIPFIQTGAANTTDNVVFHFDNTSAEGFDVHKLVVSSAEAGLWSIYYGRTYASGGTTAPLSQMNVTSGRTQNMAAFYGTALTLDGTANLLVASRCAAGIPFDLLFNTEALQVEPSGTFEIRFQADAGGNVMTGTTFIHGTEPWE